MSRGAATCRLPLALLLQTAASWKQRCGIEEDTGSWVHDMVEGIPCTHIPL